MLTLDTFRNSLSKNKKLAFSNFCKQLDITGIIDSNLFVFLHPDYDIQSDYIYTWSSFVWDFMGKSLIFVSAQGKRFLATQMYQNTKSNVFMRQLKDFCGFFGLKSRTFIEESWMSPGKSILVTLEIADESRFKTAINAVGIVDGTDIELLIDENVFDVKLAV